MTTMADAPVTADVTFELALEELHLPDDNVRTKIGDVAELAASIKSVGLLEPIVVMPRRGSVDRNDHVVVLDGYLVVCGSRRVSAAAAAGLTHVPAIVREFTEAERVEAMAIENLQREDLTPLEEAAAFQRLAELGYSQRGIAERLGVSQGHVSKRIALLELPAKIQTAVDSGGITLEDAAELLKLKDAAGAMERAYKARGQHYRGIGGAVKEEIETAARRATVAAAEEKLRAAGVRVLEVRVDTAYYDPAPPKGAVKIEKNPTYGNVLRLNPETHASEPCHAAFVAPRSGEVVYVCTDRKRHPKAKTAEEAYRSRSGRDDGKRREHDKALKAAAKVRRELAGTVLAKRLPKDDVVFRIVSALIVRAERDAQKIAFNLLDATATSTSRTDFEEQLTAIASTSPAAALKVGLALAFATEEIRLGWTWSRWGAREKAYLEFLEQQGYEISAAERAELNGKPPR